jgi:hypothetical protein
MERALHGVHAALQGRKIVKCEQFSHNLVRIDPSRLTCGPHRKQWQKLGELDQDTAKQLYVRTLTKSIPNWYEPVHADTALMVRSINPKLL